MGLHGRSARSGRGDSSAGPNAGPAEVVSRAHRDAALLLVISWGRLADPRQTPRLVSQGRITLEGRIDAECGLEELRQLTHARGEVCGEPDPGAVATACA